MPKKVNNLDDIADSDWFIVREQGTSGRWDLSQAVDLKPLANLDGLNGEGSIKWKACFEDRESGEQWGQENIPSSERVDEWK